jgi:hypothetical protein
MSEIQSDEIREQKSPSCVNIDEVYGMNEFDFYDFREPKSLFDFEHDTLTEGLEPKSLFTPTDVHEPPPLEPKETSELAQEQEDIGFWRRQFQPEPTRTQRGFDWTFGVILPIICFVCDPIVFKEPGYHDGGLLGAYAPFAYILAAISITSMILWLTWAKHYRAANAAFSGLFAAGALISLIVGIALLPFSLLGLIVLIGALGFTPLFSSFIYLRNSYRSFRLAANWSSVRLIRHIFVLAALWCVVFPYVMNVQAGTWKNPVTFIRQIYYGR